MQEKINYDILTFKIDSWKWEKKNEENTWWDLLERKTLWQDPKKLILLDEIMHP